MQIYSGLWEYIEITYAGNQLKAEQMLIIGSW